MGKIIKRNILQTMSVQQKGHFNFVKGGGGNTNTMKTKTVDHVDFFNLAGRTEGDVAAFLNSNSTLNPEAMRPFIDEKDGKNYVTTYDGGDPKRPQSYSAKLVANATLRRDEWKHLDEALLRISERRLRGIQDLVDNGLVYNLPGAMGVMSLEYHSMSDAMEAELTMDGITRSLGDRPTFETHYLPIPVIHSDFEINLRALEASRRVGLPLSTLYIERAGHKVMSLLEDMLFTDTSYSFGGGTIYSYLNHPDRNLITLGTYGDWDDDSATTALEILECVKAMKQASVDAFHFGPWMLYVPLQYLTRLDNDYDMTTPGTTIRERLMKIDGIKGVKVIDALRSSEDSLEEDNILLVEMQPETVRLVRGMGIQTVQWDEEGKFVTKYKVMSIQVPQVRSDQDGNSGIVHAS